jgi:tetratricopeptide (TPR) repeat protein
MSIWPLLNSIYGYARTIFFAITASSATIGGGFITYKVIQSDTVFIEQIKVPSAFEELGFTSEIVTDRLIDHVIFLNNRTPSAKDRSKFADSKIDLDKIDTNVAGFSLKEFVATIGEFFGKQIKKISGEITLVKDGDKTFYKIKLRQTPERIILVEFQEEMSPEDFIKKIALKLIEKTDPHVAASLYQGVFRDKVNAYRMIDVVLSDDNVQNHKYSLNLRSQMYLNEGKYDDAWNDLKRSLEIDPNFSATHANMSGYYQSIKNFEKAEDESDISIKLDPSKPYGYVQKGRIVRERKEYDNAINYFIKGLEADRYFYPAYNLIALTYLTQNKLDEASKWFIKGAKIRPEFPYFYYNYGRILTKQYRHYEALIQYQNAVNIDQENHEFIIAIIECYDTLKMHAQKEVAIHKLNRYFVSGLYASSVLNEKTVDDFLKLHMKK